MAATDSGYGFKPVKLVGGQPYAGSTNMYNIASGYNTNIFTGSIVSIIADGTIAIVTTDGSDGSTFPDGTIGVFMGCEYTDPNSGQLLHSQYWPANTVAADARAYVVDDPRVIFQVQAAGAVTAVDLGQNTHLAAVQSTSTGSTTTGLSDSQVDATTNTTATWAFRIVGFHEIEGFSSIGDAFTDLYVVFNPSEHSLTNATGI